MNSLGDLLVRPSPLDASLRQVPGGEGLNGLGRQQQDHMSRPSLRTHALTSRCSRLICPEGWAPAHACTPAC